MWVAVVHPPPVNEWAAMQLMTIQPAHCRLHMDAARGLDLSWIEATLYPAHARFSVNFSANYNTAVLQRLRFAGTPHRITGSQGKTRSNLCWPLPGVVARQVLHAAASNTTSAPQWRYTHSGTPSSHRAATMWHASNAVRRMQC
jgi:hypothetical protein